MRVLVLVAALAACRLGFDESNLSGANGDTDGGNGDGDGGNGDGDGGVGTGDVGTPTTDALMLAPSVRIAAGTAHTCALTAAGRVRCWGDGQYGQLGYGNTQRIGDNEQPATAGDVSVGGTVVQIVAGEAHTCVLLENGNVRCWGDSMFGQLGYANTTRIGDDELPSSIGVVDVGAPVMQIAGGIAFTCALTLSGGVRCWGDNQYGQLGYGNTQNVGDTETPASRGDIPLGGTATAISAGTAHACALMMGGAVRCWGDAMFGQLGYGNVTRIGDNEPPSMAGDVPLGTTAIAISADEVHTCAITTANNVRCWGDNQFGQLGYGNTTRRGDNEPASQAGDVPLGMAAVELEMGIAHTCARSAAGAVRCWGDAFYGQLGYGNTTAIGDTEAASQGGNVAVGGTVSEIAAGLTHTCARLSTGTVRCWGQGMLGRLGYGNTQNIGDSETPQQTGDVPF